MSDAPVALVSVSRCVLQSIQRALARRASQSLRRA
jgi:hypothetical protein